MHFRLLEDSSGLASILFLRHLEEEVMPDADTWDCGDFGSITSSIATGLVIDDTWDSLFAFTDPDQVQIRVSLADAYPRVLGPDGERIPESVKQTCENPDHVSRFRWRLF